MNLSLESQDLLLCLEVGEMSGIQTSRKTALGQQNSRLSSGVSGEASSALLLDSSVALNTGESHSTSNSLVGADNGFLTSDHSSSSRNVRDRQETTGGITVRIVGACSGSQTSRKLRSTEGGGSQGKDNKRGHRRNRAQSILCRNLLAV